MSLFKAGNDAAWDSVCLNFLRVIIKTDASFSNNRDPDQQQASIANPRTGLVRREREDTRFWRGKPIRKWWAWGSVVKDMDDIVHMLGNMV